MFLSASARTLRLPLAALLALVCGWFAAPAHAGERGPKAQQTPAALYHNYCSVCHGDAGDGKSRAQNSLKPPPRDFTTIEASQELTRERMLSSVRNGVRGTAMIGWSAQLTDGQINAVVDYVRATFMRPSVNDASRGRQIYARICSVCHGDQGGGSMWASQNLRPPPRDFTAAATKAELTRERMITAVSQGRPNSAMQAYATRLSREDQEAVVDYIRSAIMRVDADKDISGTRANGGTAVAKAQPAAKGKGQHDHEHSHSHGPGEDHAAHGHNPGKLTKDGRIDMKLPMPHGLKPDVVAGKKFYEANCAVCHGNKGDGQGPRAYFINPKPAVFITEKSRQSYNRPTLFDAVSTGRRGTEMPAWDKVLTPQEIANVAEYVFQAFIRPAPANVAKQ